MNAFTKFGDRELQPYCYPPNNPYFPHKGDNSVSYGNNKDNMAVSPAERETLAENLRFQRSTDEDIVHCFPWDHIYSIEYMKYIFLLFWKK